MRKLIWIFALLTAWTNPGLNGQTESEKISIHFSTFAWKGTDTRNLFYIKNGQFEPLQISQAFYKGPFDYTGPNPMVFYKKVAAEDGTMVQTPVATVPINPSLNNVFLLFLRSTETQNKSDTGLRILSLSNDLETFPKGSYRIYNLSEYEIGGIFSDQKFTIASKTFKTVELDGLDHVDVRIHFSTKINDEWVSQINTRWRHEDLTRNIVFVTDDKNSRHPKLELKTITQYFTE